MARLSVLAALLAFAAAASAQGLTPTEYGIVQTNAALTAVCWYENLKQFPKTDSRQYGKCSSAETVTGMLKAKGYTGRMLEGSYVGSMQLILDQLPSAYKSQCKKHLDSKAAATSDNESDTLNDGGHEYPFRAFAYCLMKTLRQQHGNKAIEAVKSERTHSLKHWRDTLHDRENEFRARHGAQPLTLVQELIDRAQRWSDENAAKCKSGYHIPREHPDYKWNGDATGENLAGNTGPDDSAANAYSAIDGWYEEISNYPFPQGVDDSDGGNGVIGHFTQTVWADSKYVGYGYTYNKNCPGSKVFITARYSRAGNYPGEFRKNVQPPQN